MVQTKNKRASQFSDKRNAHLLLLVTSTAAHLAALPTTGELRDLFVLVFVGLLAARREGGGAYKGVHNHCELQTDGWKTFKAK